MPEVDPVQKATMRIDVVHHEVHDGVAFRASHEFSGVAGSGVVETLVKVGSNKNLHMAFGTGVGGNTRIEIFEGPTITANGTAIDKTNFRRTGTPPTSDATLFHTPTTTADGTKIIGSVAFGGSSGATKVGGRIRQGLEFILKKSENYLVRTTNISAGAHTICHEFEWYEEALP